jgi:DNA-binding response OmpR family regulator
VIERTGEDLSSVLIVTGSERTRRMYAEYFTWRGVQVREVYEAAAAISELSTFRPDVVVTEDRLPDSSGQDLVRALRRSRHTFELPIVLLSSNIFTDPEEQARRRGCDRLLTVPLLPESLYEAVRSVVDRCATKSSARPFESWLFIRKQESVWIVRTADLELAIAGPGRKRSAYAFTSEHDLLTFHSQFEDRLRHTGFELETSSVDRRCGHDRRREPRPGSVDRRAVH